MKITIRELRERASKTLSVVGELYDVRTLAVDAYSKHPLVAGPFSVSAGLSLNARCVPGKRLDVLGKYRLQAESSSDLPVTAWSINLAMIASWHYEGAQEIEERDLDSFAVVTGGMTIHPFAREAVQSAVSHMGYPPFTMEMLWSPLGESDDQEIDFGESDESWPSSALDLDS